MGVWDQQQQQRWGRAEGDGWEHHPLSPPQPTGEHLHLVPLLGEQRLSPKTTSCPNGSPCPTAGSTSQAGSAGAAWTPLTTCQETSAPLIEAAKSSHGEPLV